MRPALFNFGVYMRNPSYTKSGPGRRPAHASKARALFDRMIQAQKRAQEPRKRKQKGYVLMPMENRATGRSWNVCVFHDDAITMRDGAVFVSGSLVA